MNKDKNRRFQKRTVGSFLKVPIDGKYHTYARILPRASIAFYDYKTDVDENNLERIAESPILFIVAVHKDAVTKGRWQKIGKLPLEPELRDLPLKFIQDPLDLSRFSIYEPNTGEIRPATREECEGLERASVWDEEHVEERLKAHYEGRPSVWVEQQKIREPNPVKKKK